MAQVFGREFLHMEILYPWEHVPEEVPGYPVVPVIKRTFRTLYCEQRFGYCLGAFQNLGFPRIEIRTLECRTRIESRTEWTRNNVSLNTDSHDVEWTRWAPIPDQYVVDYR